MTIRSNNKEISYARERMIWAKKSGMKELNNFQVYNLSTPGYIVDKCREANSLFRRKYQQLQLDDK